MAPPRSPTRQSIHSWWSDSNPVGATISLHAAAKPLMSLLYQRQARGFIKSNQGTLLSKTIVDVYFSYLAFKYISPTTKLLVLKELDTRATAEQEDACSIVDSLVVEPDLVSELLESPHPAIRRSTCWLFTHLAGHKSATVAFLPLGVRLVPLLQDPDTSVIESALFALWVISEVPDGARAVVEAQAVEHVSQLLHSSHDKFRRWTCGMLGTLARHDSTIMAVLAIKPSIRLVSLLSEDYMQDLAMSALCEISTWPDGAQAVVDADIMKHVSEFLRSTRTSEISVRNWACEILGILMRNESTAAAVLPSTPCMALVSFLNDKDIRTDIVINTLCEISQWADGGQLLVAARVLDHVLGLLSSPSPHTRRCTCKMLGNLVRHESTVAAVLGLNPCAHLVQLLRDNDPLVVKNATFAISVICGSPELEIITAPDTEIQSRTSEDRERLWLAAILKSSFPYPRHGSIPSPTKTIFLKEVGVRIIPEEDARAVADSLVLQSNLIDELFESSDGEVRRMTCNLLSHLAQHEYAAAIVGVKACVRLVSILHDEAINDRAIYALSELSKWPDGARAAVDAKVLEYTQELLDSPDPHLRRWTCQMLGHLARHKSTAVAVLVSEPSVRLVSLLSDEDEVIEASIYALCGITRWQEGAEISVDAKAVECAQKLLRLPNIQIKRSTLQMVGNLAAQESTVAAVLPLESSVVPLLRHKESDIRRYAAYVLYVITQWPEYGQTTVHSETLACLLDLLDSSDASVRSWICCMLGNIVRKTTAVSILAVEPCTHLLSVLRDEESAVRQWATYALYEISKWPAGAQALLGAKAPDYTLELFAADRCRARGIFRNLMNAETDLSLDRDPARGS
ncbi:armadillo-type protein [Mycena leptocephala]|nr:armadillo-type protein [Mycena leptocephala]